MWPFNTEVYPFHVSVLKLHSAPCVQQSLFLSWIIETITKLPLKAELRLLYLWSQVQVSGQTNGNSAVYLDATEDEIDNLKLVLLFHTYSVIALKDEQMCWKVEKGTHTMYIIRTLLYTSLWSKCFLCCYAWCWYCGCCSRTSVVVNHNAINVYCNK